VAFIYEFVYVQLSLTSVCACEIVDCICEFMRIKLSLIAVIFFPCDIVAYICEFVV
jgi:hypothetical protein